MTLLIISIFAIAAGILTLVSYYNQRTSTESSKIGFIFAVIMCIVSIYGFVVVGNLKTEFTKTSYVEPFSVTKTNNLTIVVNPEGNFSQPLIVSNDGWIYHANIEKIKILRTDCYNCYKELFRTYYTITILDPNPEQKEKVENETRKN